MKNKDGYYKVYKDDLHDMCKLGLTQNLIEGWLEKIEERRANYLYVSHFTSSGGFIIWGYNFYDKSSVDWYKSRDVEYLGEFKTIRKRRKEKLEKLNRKCNF